MMVLMATVLIKNQARTNQKKDDMVIKREDKSLCKEKKR